MRKIVTAFDHAGVDLHDIVIKTIKECGCDVIDVGTDSSGSVDYPDYAHPLGKAIDSGEYKRGIVICGSGNGVQMTVNKYGHVRCALCWTEEIASLGRQHNDCNVIALPARFIPQDVALNIVDTFLDTAFEGGRHQRRVDKIAIK